MNWAEASGSSAWKTSVEIQSLRAAGHASRFADDAGRLKPSDVVERTLQGGVQRLGDAGRREHRILKHQVDHLDRAGPVTAQPLAVTLTEVDESLGATDGVVGKFRDPGEEEHQLLAQLTPLAHGLEAVVVLTAVLLEVGTEVRQRPREQLLFDQQERDQQATQSPLPSRNGWIASNW